MAASVRGGQSETPTFRTNATVVTVPVSVRQNGRPVTGLTASDFLVTDDGVSQQVERVSFEEVPIDVTLVLDVSASTSDVVARLRRDARRILGYLRATDRIRILAIDTFVHELRPLQSYDADLTLPASPAQTGATSLFDALTAALATRADPNRRRLVVVLSDGDDTASVNDASALRRMAQRLDAVLHVVIVNARDGVVSHALDELAAAARDTGGALARPGARSSADPVGIFRQVFEEFRYSYVLDFVPAGVSDRGWHPLMVRVRNLPPGSVRARAGYAAGAP